MGSAGPAAQPSAHVLAPLRSPADPLCRLAGLPARVHGGHAADVPGVARPDAAGRRHAHHCRGLWRPGRHHLGVACLPAGGDGHHPALRPAGGSAGPAPGAGLRAGAVLRRLGARPGRARHGLAGGGAGTAGAGCGRADGAVAGPHRRAGARARAGALPGLLHCGVHAGRCVGAGDRWAGGAARPLALAVRWRAADRRAGPVARAGPAAGRAPPGAAGIGHRRLGHWWLCTGQHQPAAVAHLRRAPLCLGVGRECGAARWLAAGVDGARAAAATAW